MKRVRRPAPLPAPAAITKSVTRLLTTLWRLEGRASYADTRVRLEAYALPAHGDKHVDKLTAESLRKWHRDLAKSPRRVRTKEGRTGTSDPPD